MVGLWHLQNLPGCSPTCALPTLLLTNLNSYHKKQRPEGVAMNNFNFGEILTRAWQIIWKHKVLWVFGILASCGRGGSSGNSGNSGSSGDNGFGGSDLPPQVMQWF